MLRKHLFGRWLPAHRTEPTVDAKLGARTPSSANACAARASVEQNRVSIIVRAARSMRAKAPALPVVGVAFIPRIFGLSLLTILLPSLFPTGTLAQTGKVSAAPIANSGLRSKADELLTRYAMYGMSGTVMIVKDDQIVFHKAYGLADRENRRPNTLGSVYDVGSIAKTFTATAILQLEAQGRLKTSDVISKFLGDFPADKAGITIHHLLTHTSGLGLDAGDVGINPTTPPDEFLRKVKDAPLLSPPGRQYSYSNLGYGLLAIIIEKLSGLSWQNYLKTNILKPAGLSHTLLYGDRLPKEVAHGYIGSSEDELELEAPLRLERPDSYVWRKYTIGSGGVFSTTGDLYKWWQALHSEKVFSAEARAKMFSVQAATQGYGWNIQSRSDGATRTYRGGLRGSYQSMLGYYAKENALLIFGLNKNVTEIGWAGVVWNNLEKLIRGGDYVVPPAIVSIPPATLQPYAGNYELGNGEGFVVRIEKNSLQLGAIGQAAVNFLAYPQQTPPAFLGDIAQAGRQVVQLLGRNDLQQLTRRGFIAEKDLPVLRARWTAWMNTTGKLKSFQVLGVSPGSGGNPRTFVKLNGEKSSLVIRLLWNWNQKRVTAWGDNVPLPASVKLLPESETSFVNFDFEKSQTVRVRFDAGALIMRSADGSEVAARKSDRTPNSNEPVIEEAFQDSVQIANSPESQPSDGRYADYVGRFQTARGAVTFRQEEEKLICEAGGERLELAPDIVAKDKFTVRAGSEVFTFERDTAGKVIGVIVNTGPGQEIRGKRIE